MALWIIVGLLAAILVLLGLIAMQLGGSSASLETRLQRLHAAVWEGLWRGGGDPYLADLAQRVRQLEELARANNATVEAFRATAAPTELERRLKMEP
jgi:hypothetical protein